MLNIKLFPFNFSPMNLIADTGMDKTFSFALKNISKLSLFN